LLQKPWSILRRSPFVDHLAILQLKVEAHHENGFKADAQGQWLIDWAGCEDMTVSVTGFTGVNLLHVVKAIKLMGWHPTTLFVISKIAKNMI
jgi:hypothetical protein